MRRYLATLHRQPDRHKKRFALLVSGGVTVLIFVIWTLVTFGTGGTLAEDNNTKRAHEEVSPIDSLRASATEGFDAAQDSFSQLREGVLNIHGQ
ncbi:MAG: hypothetical protein EXS69_00060 [Candidatus Zambryskibacteria bacterium]|nr:hypothetical protein [Candidatus Zambryskibacteria bacterium]